MDNTADNLRSGAMLGLTGAVSIAVIDSVITRAPFLRTGGRTRRIFSRLVLAGAIAYGASKASAPSVVVKGIVAGAVLMSTLDILVWTITGFMPMLNPPPVKDAQRIGEPWAPQPMYSLPATFSSETPSSP